MCVGKFSAQIEFLRLLLRRCSRGHLSSMEREDEKIAEGLHCAFSGGATRQTDYRTLTHTRVILLLVGTSGQIDRCPSHKPPTRWRVWALITFPKLLIRIFFLLSFLHVCHLHVCNHAEIPWNVRRKDNSSRTEWIRMISNPWTGPRTTKCLPIVPPRLRY